MVVKVPTGASHYSTGEISVSGTAKTLPDNKLYDLNEIKGKIRISYYTDWDLVTKDPSKSVDKGDKTYFLVDVQNQGNAKDKFFQDIANSIELKDYDITFVYPPDVEIDEKSTEEVKITVKTSEKTPAGEYYIEFYSYPEDVDKYRESDNEYYFIKFKLTVEPDFVEQYLLPSVIVFIIVIIIVIAKLFVFNKNKKISGRSLFKLNRTNNS